MRSSAEKWLTVAIRLCIPFLIIGVLFKIMHWPADKALIVGSLVCLGTFSIIRFCVLGTRQILDYIRLSLNVSFALYGSLHILHWPGKLIPGILLIASIALWAWFDGFELNKSDAGIKKTTSQKISNTLFIVGGAVTVVGIVLKIMHWPGAGISLIIGIAALSVAFFSGVLKEE